VRHSRGPTNHDLVVGPERIFERDLLIRERAANLIDLLLKLTRPANLDTRLILSDGDAIFSHQIVDGLSLSLIPYFLEPTPHQNNIFFDGHATPSFQSTGQLDAL
jgi:hypothetical protein